MIELKNVTVRFGSRAVLDRFNARIPFSGTTMISGASGSGKTTLLRVLLGLQRIDSGEICGLFGRKLSAVFQEDRLLPWLTALENVQLVSDHATAQRYLNALGLADALGQKPAQLSGGMKRRVAIARALAYRGEMLLLDEPFTGLDAEAMQTCAEALLAENKPIVLVTHSGAEAELLRASVRVSLE